MILQWTFGSVFIIYIQINSENLHLDFFLRFTNFVIYSNWTIPHSENNILSGPESMNEEDSVDLLVSKMGLKI